MRNHNVPIYEYSSSIGSCQLPNRHFLDMTRTTAFRFPRDHGSRGSGSAVQHSIRSGGGWSQRSDGSLWWKGEIHVYIRDIDELTDLDFLSNARVLAENLGGHLLRETLHTSVDPSLIKLTGDEALKWSTTAVRCRR